MTQREQAAIEKNFIVRKEASFADPKKQGGKPAQQGLPYARLSLQQEMLNEFVRLAGSDSGNAEVLRFTRKYGPLGLCEHDQPFHCYRRVRLAGAQRAERIDAWRSYARQAKILVESYQWLAHHSHARQEDVRALSQSLHAWQAYTRGAVRFRLLLDRELAGKGNELLSPRQKARTLIQHAINRWLATAHFQFVAEPSKKRGFASISNPILTPEDALRISRSAL